MIQYCQCPNLSGGCLSRVERLTSEWTVSLSVSVLCGSEIVSPLGSSSGSVVADIVSAGELASVPLVAASALAEIPSSNSSVSSALGD